MVPRLLLLPPRTSLHGDEMVEKGFLILQDRSSCLSALALSPPAGAHVIDTCSAPGNKTCVRMVVAERGEQGVCA